MSTLWTQLSWSQYKLLLAADNQDKREFYIAETVKNNWTVRQLERQINSSLFESLLMSSDRKDVLAVAGNEKLPSDAREIIKTLEFCNPQYHWARAALVLPNNVFLKVACATET